MFGGSDELVEVPDGGIEIDDLAALPQAERPLDLQGDGDDEARSAQPALARLEEVAVLRVGAAEHLARRQHDVQREDHGGDHAELDAGTVGGRGDDPRDGLVRNRAEVGHGEAVLGEDFVQDVQADAAFDDDIFFLGVDLDTNKTKTGDTDGNDDEGREDGGRGGDDGGESAVRRTCGTGEDDGGGQRRGVKAGQSRSQNGNSRTEKGQINNAASPSSARYEKRKSKAKLTSSTLSSLSVRTIMPFVQAKSLGL